MRKIPFLLLIFAAASCQKDETAPASSDPRTPFAASWNCEENSKQNGTSTFEVHINKSTTSSSQLLIENLYNYGLSFVPYAEINSAGTGFTIPSQVVQGNNVKGSGTLLGTTTINMSYIIDNGSSADSVTAVLTKK